MQPKILRGWQVWEVGLCWWSYSWFEQTEVVKEETKELFEHDEGFKAPDEDATDETYVWNEWVFKIFKNI